MQIKSNFKVLKCTMFIFLITLITLNNALAQNYTVCRGDNIEVGPFPDPPRALDRPPGPEGSGDLGLPGCIFQRRNISPSNGVVSNIENGYILSPQVTTTYTYTSYYGGGSSNGCNPGDEFSVTFTVFVEENCEPCQPGSSPDCPYIMESCPGERVTLIGSNVGAPPPPLIVVIDVGTLDFSNVDYRIDGPNGNVCVDCNFAWVSPQTTSLYTLTWANTIPPTPPSQFYGTGYFLVEVQDCSTQTDLTAPNESPDIKFVVTPTELTREGKQGIRVDFYNEGPGYVESADFVWEVNGVNEGTTSYIGSSVLAGKTISARLSDYYFEAGTDYTIKVTATNVNGGADLNPLNNVYEFFLPAFDAAPNLGLDITEPVNPIENGVGVVKVNVVSRGTSYVNDFVINWSVNGNLQTPYTVNDADWGTFSPSSGSLTYSIGSVDFSIEEDYEIKAWVELLGNEEDVDFTNNEATFFYSAEDRLLYNADEVFTICEGETLTFTKNYHSYGEGCWICFSDLLNPTWSLNGTTIATGNEIVITPTSSGLYRFTSDANSDCNPEFCGPGPVGPQPYQVEFVEREYGVIVVPCNDGGKTDEIFDDYTWLNTVVDVNNCNGTSVTVYDAGTFNYLFVETNEGGALYFQDGTYYCTERSNFNCVDAYNLTEVVDTWNCGIIEVEILGCTDPRALNYNPEATIDDDNCEYGIRAEIFEEYEWLESIVDVSNCLGTSVTVYTTGNFNYLFVETNEGGALYFQDGTYYCTERSNFNCVDAYGLTEIVDTWNCGIIEVEILGCTDPRALNYNPEATIDDDNCEYGIRAEIFEEYEWLESIVDVSNCAGSSAIVYTTGTFNYLFVETNDGAALYFQDGTYYCTERNNFNCVDAYNLTEVIDSWVCGSTAIAICDLSPDAGPCDANEQRFYYDKTEGDCKQFSYGGCEGNANNFDNYFVCMENACVEPIECPEGEPIEWDWVQRRIENSDGCFPNSISAFESNGVTYISTSVSGSDYCPTDYPITYYSCKGNYVCFAGGLTAPWVETGCDFGQTTNSRNIWTYSENVLGCTDTQATNYNVAATIDDGSCVYNYNINVFDDYPWLYNVVEVGYCQGAVITVYQSGIFNFVYVEVPNLGYADLYFEDGTYYCSGSPSRSCLSLYNLTNAIDSWTCPGYTEILGCTDANATNYYANATQDDGSCEYEPTPNCNNHTGTFFFEDCGGQTYFFIETTNGQTFDPYFAEGIRFSPLEGQTVNFDYVINTDITTPCNISESPITITCIEIVESDTEIFGTYPWLSSVVDPNNCEGASITVYTTGTFNYLFVETNEGGALYFQDGTYYCTERSNFNCVDAYNLTEVVNTWACALGAKNFEKSSINNIESANKALNIIEAKLYPNPTIGEFNIELSQPIEKTYSVNVFDMNGQLIQSLSDQTQQKVKVDLTSRPEGVYMVQLLGKNLIQMQKLIKH